MQQCLPVYILEGEGAKVKGKIIEGKSREETALVQFKPRVSIYTFLGVLSVVTAGEKCIFPSAASGEQNLDICQEVNFK